MDKIRAMQTFVCIAEQGSLSAASRALNVSLPAVVRLLAALEQHLRVRLINRTTRRLALTEEGRLYLASCRDILTAVNDAETAVTVEGGEPVGTLVITAPVLFGQLHIAPIVTRFVQRHQGLKCRVMLQDRVVNLLEEGVDVGIRIGHLADSSLVAQPLGLLRRMVVASPTYLQHHGRPLHPDDLLRANCVTFNAATGPWWTFREGGRDFSVAVQGNLDFNHAGPAVEACVAGLGFGMFISYQVQPYLEQGLLEVVLEIFEPEPRPVHIVYPHARLLPMRTRAFIDYVKQELRLDPGLDRTGTINPMPLPYAHSVPHRSI